MEEDGGMPDDVSDVYSSEARKTNDDGEVRDVDASRKSRDSHQRPVGLSGLIMTEVS